MSDVTTVTLRAAVGPLAMDVELLLERANGLRGVDIVALSRARRFGIVETFDMLADEGLHASGWHNVWEAASETVHRAAQRARRSDVWECEPDASDVVAAAAVALFLQRSLTDATYNRLMAGWLVVAESAGWR